MLYIKLDSDMDLVITVNEPIYRGDNLSRKITYLLPLTVGEIDMATACVFLNYVRADGTPDIVLLDRLPEKYNESYYQYTFPIDCKLTKYPGEVCTWMQIYTGTPSNPTISKTGECMLYIMESKNMDDYLCDHQVTAIYQLHKSMSAGFEQMEEAIAAKADNIIFHSDDSTIQLVSNGEPVGDRILISSQEVGVAVSDAVINDNGELVVYFTNGSEKNLGVVVGEGGQVYIPHISDRKILTFTIEDMAGEIPDPVDLNPFDEWKPVDQSSVETDYVWEEM